MSPTPNETTIVKPNPNCWGCGGRGTPAGVGAIERRECSRCWPKSPSPTPNNAAGAGTRPATLLERQKTGFAKLEKDRSEGRFQNDIGYEEVRKLFERAIRILEKCDCCFGRGYRERLDSWGNVNKLKCECLEGGAL